MKKILIMLLAAALLALGGADPLAAQSGGQTGEKAMNLKDKKILLVYFSHSGNTAALAKQIQAVTGGEMFEVTTVTPYPEEYRATTEAARRELDEGSRPALKNAGPDLDGYEVIFIGYPNWWGTLPMALFTFLEGRDLAGKTVVPFTTHEGSRFGRSLDDLTRLTPGATLVQGFEIRGSRAANAGSALTDWLGSLGF
jgi:Flavodoxins